MSIVVETRRIAACALWALAIACVGACAPPEEPDTVIEDDFWMGVNLPWIHYGHDLGTAWDHDGVSSAPSRELLRTELSALKARGVSVVRFFLFADGRAAPELDGQRRVSGLEPIVYDDMDALLEVAAEADIDLLPVLFDYLWFAAPTMAQGVTMGGRADIITDVDARTSLLQSAIVPFVARYASHPRIRAWDLINEPEWAIAGDGALVEEAISDSAMTGWLAELRDTVRAQSDHPITIGSASLNEMMARWTDFELDVLQFHHYTGAPLDTPVDELGVDVPVLVGELPSVGSVDDLVQQVRGAEDLGYLGVLPWSLRGEDEATDRAVLEEALDQLR